MNAPFQKTWRERLGSPLISHGAGLAILSLLILGMFVWLCIDWSALDSTASTAMNAKEIELKILTSEMAPLRGVEKRLVETREQIDSFYAERISSNYSSIAIRVGELAVQSGVRLSQVQYTQGRPDTSLTEISMDAGITGGYPQIMRFVNELERDRNFFVIRAMVLTGQEGGQVSLRLRVSTWLRTADATASGIPATPKPGVSVPQVSVSERKGD
ncbi:MAG: GspMb/PilO family protein [Acidobacteriaceae bacterium]|nr:GspMb/PilO family protein [Acidobacteriaceae bacterium]